MAKESAQGSGKPESLCPRCGKRSASESEKGSLTAYLFQGSLCNCGAGAAQDNGSTRSSARKKNALSSAFQSLGRSAERLWNPRAAGGDEFCRRCGLKVMAQSQPGSITGYLFQDVRCKCPPDPVFSPGEMSQRLIQLKKAESGKTFASAGAATISGGNNIDLATGAVIDHLYEIKSLIGRGGMGEVYLAHHLSLDRECALKLIPPAQVSEIGWRRFQLEARTVGKLQHKNIVHVSDLGIHDGCLPFYAMEFVPGQSLATLLETSGPMTVSRAIPIFKQVCDGVEHAHRHGVIHRDLKPANIMISETASGAPLVKILDFGLAKLTEADRNKQSLTSVGEVFGSPYYMSPEQCAGEKIDNRSDIYSIGCTLFECLTGRPPFAGGLAAAIMISQQEAEPPSLKQAGNNKKFSESIELVLAKLLRKNPVERYQTAGELRMDLEVVESGGIVQPFYVKRHASTQAEEAEIRAGASIANKADYSAPYAVLPVGRIIIATITILVMVLSIFSFLFYGTWRRDQALTHAHLLVESTALTNKDIQTERLLHKGASEFSNALTMEKVPFDGKPYFTGLTTNYGITYRNYSFPMQPGQRNAIGHFYLGDKAEKTILLQGKVQVPANIQIQFVPSALAVYNPGLLAGFGDGDFSTLAMPRVEMMESMFDDSEPDKMAFAFAENFPKMNSVTTLSSPAAQGEVNDHFLPSLIKKLPNLQNLEINSPLSEAACTHIHCWQSLHNISYMADTGAPPYLSKIRGSRALIALSLNVRTITDQDIDDISKCPELTNIKIANYSARNTILITEQQTSMLSKLRNLQTLDLTLVQCSTRTIENLSKLQSLENMSFSGDKKWTPADINRLKMSLPRCHVKVRDEQWDRHSFTE